MISHLGGSLFLGDDSFRSEALGVREVLLSLGGRSRDLYELATGTNPHASTDPPSTVRNPDGDLGHNHSGPPYGQAFRHPIATVSRKKASSGLQAPSDWEIADLTANASGVTIRWVIWNRRYSPLPSGWIPPYSRAYVRLIAYRPSATATTLDVSIAALDNTGQPVGAYSTDSIAMTSTSEAAYTSTAFVLLRPGRNVIGLRFTSSDAGGSTAPIVTAVALNQIQKLTH